MRNVLFAFVAGFLVHMYSQGVSPFGHKSGFVRGDKVVASFADPKNAWAYKDCKYTYIDSIHITEGDVAFLSLTGCDYPRRDLVFADIFPLDTLTKETK